MAPEKCVSYIQLIGHHHHHHHLLAFFFYNKFNKIQQVVRRGDHKKPPGL